MWSEPTPREVFWKRLLDERVSGLSEPDGQTLLREMRTRYDVAQECQRAYAPELDARGTSMVALIAQACGETWHTPPPDDEKSHEKSHAPIEKTEPHANAQLDSAREGGVREREHIVQAGTQRGVQDVEKEEGLPGFAFRG